jgi:hypothetical protein
VTRLDGTVARQHVKTTLTGLTRENTNSTRRPCRRPRRGTSHVLSVYVVP